MKFINAMNLKITTISLIAVSITASICSLGGITTQAHAEQLRKNQINNIVNSIAAYKTYDKNERLYELTLKHIEENMDPSLEIETAKPLADFGGNLYTLFELDPYGYAIYHNDSGKYIEYTSKSISPYIGYTGELYYGGAMEYYYSDNETLYHTLKEDSTIDKADIKYYAEKSNQMAAALNEQVITANLSYIDGSSKKVDIKVEEETESNTQVRTVSSVAPNISMADFFTNLKTSTQIGYTGGGVCGYVAVNLILGYNYFAYDRGLVNKNYVNETTRTMNGPLLTERLMTLNGLELGEDDYPGTDATTFYKLMDKYFDEIHNTKDWDIQWRVLATDAVNTLKKGFPVALFGNLPDYDEKHVKCNHAVVAYGYGKYGLFKSLVKYRVHYGWYNREDMWLESPIVGTDLFLTLS